MVRIAMLSIAVGLTLALSSAPADATMAYVRSTTRTVVVARDDGSHARAIARGVWPVISPNGRWVAFTTAGGSLRLVAAAGGKSRLLLRAPDVVPPTTARWSADSRFLIAGNAEPAVVIIDVHTGRRLTVPLGLGDPIAAADYGGGAISPKDDVAVFTRVTGGAPDYPPLMTLYSVPITSRGRPHVAIRGGYEPMWGARGLACLGPRGLVFRRRLSARPRPLPSVGDPVGWSRDGWRLLTEEWTGAYVQPGYSFVYRPVVTDIRTGRQTRIPGSFSAVDGFARHGRSILAESDGDVVLVSGDGTTRVVAEGAGEATATG